MHNCPTRHHPSRLLAILALAALPLVSTGLETYLTMENDSPMGFDCDMTHSTKLEAVTDPGWHYMLSQTMYAPDDLSLKHHRPGDRPYAGMLIGGVGYELRQLQPSPWTHYAELDFGMIGPAAMCKDTQTMVHKLLHCRKPEGWDDQLHNEFVANAQWWTKYHWHLNDWMALVPKAGAAAGTIQDWGEAGADFKFGWNIRDNPNNEIIFTAPSGSASGKGGWLDKLSLYGYVGASERYYLYNHILEGTLFGHRDDGLTVDIERFVTELRCGVVLKFDRLFATCYAVFRTDEYRHEKHPPHYGGICLGWAW